MGQTLFLKVGHGWDSPVRAPKFKFLHTRILEWLHMPKESLGSPDYDGISGFSHTDLNDEIIKYQNGFLNYPVPKGSQK